MASPSIGKFAKALRIKTHITKLFGEEAYIRLRKRGIQLDTKLSRRTNVGRQALINRRSDQKMKNLPKASGLRWVEAEPISPQMAYARNKQFVTDALDALSITWWNVRGLHNGRRVVGVDSADRANVLAALSVTHSKNTNPIYVMDAIGSNPQYEIGRILQIKELETADILRIAAPLSTSPDMRKYGFSYGCDIEFWTIPRGKDSEQIVRAPRENCASMVMGLDDLSLQEVEIDGEKQLLPMVFQERMLDDVMFEVDAVYTWVDGSDPQWLEKKQRLEASITGQSFHEEASHEARFRSRDELMYSLRSIENFAPWIRKIFIVTDGQIPAWLDVSSPKITVVDHKQIFDNKDNLPTFNSNSIISRLHHIPGLSEHYVYLNDDVLLGRPVQKNHFFTPSGIALVSPSNNRRPFGPSSVLDEPHINLTRNIREILQNEFGITISRAIKHTPHPMLKSVHFEMEERFSDVYKRTWESKFRHHKDIVADQLHHYYAQIVGKAVPGHLTYNYINILDDKYSNTLKETLKNRNRDAFCINDAPVPGATPIPDETIENFFESYFPNKSQFEL